MPIRFINQDITKVDELFNCNGFAILHIGNCQNVMNAGVARALLLKWPNVKADYHSYAQTNGLHLSNIIDTKVSDLATVYTMLAQERYGNDGKKYISYDALEDCLIKVKESEDKRKLVNIQENIVEALSRNIYVPFRMGAGLAGGDWKHILNIIEDKLKSFNVYICEP